MKIEAKFKSENNRLFFLDGTECAVSQAVSVEAKDFCAKVSSLAESGKLFLIDVAWTLAGLVEEEYNEGFLADFRDALKTLEEKNAYAIINPVCDAAADDAGKKENLTLSMKHTARRIKDCENVVGFAIPQQADSSFFVDELSAKHKQYVFFSKDETVLADSSKVRL